MLHSAGNLSPRSGPPGPPRPRLRLAPSPSGGLHLGGARTALINYTFAQITGGDLLLRFDDTDHTKESYYEDALTRAYGALGIHFNGEPVRQSERWQVYRRVAHQLMARDAAYPCGCERRAPKKNWSCTCAQLSAEARAQLLSAGCAIRVRTTDAPIAFVDLIYGPRHAPPARDPVVIRRDGRALYHFATVVDDLDSGITHVLRGAEHLQGTCTQLAIYRALGAAAPRFGHIPLLLDEHGKKLSKRAGSSTVLELMRRGCSARSILALVRGAGPPSFWTALEQARTLGQAEAALSKLGRRASRMFPEQCWRFVQRDLEAVAWITQWVGALGLLPDAEAGRWLKDVTPLLLPRAASSQEFLRQWLGVLEPRLLPQPGTPSPGGAHARERTALIGQADGPPLSRLDAVLGAHAVHRRVAPRIAEADARAHREQWFARADVRQIERYVRTAYDRGDYRVTGTYQGRNRRVLRLSGNGGGIVLKLANAADALSPMAVEAECLAKLPGSVAPQSPRLDATQEIFAVPVLTHTLLEGDSRDSLNLGEVEQLGRLVAMVHRHRVEDFKRLPSGFITLQQYYHKLLSEFGEYLRLRVELGLAENALVRCVLRALENLEPLVRHWSARYPASEPVLCHGDLRVHNILRTPAGDLRLIDWETASSSDAAFDLAWACVVNNWGAAEQEALKTAYGAVRSANGDLAGKVDALRRVFMLGWPIQLMLQLALRAAGRRTVPRDAEPSMELQEIEISERLERALAALPELRTTASSEDLRAGVVSPRPRAGDGLPPHIFITGPAGALKTPVAALLARSLGYKHAALGAYFRAATWLALQRAVDLDDATCVLGVLQHASLQIVATAEPPYFSVKVDAEVDIDVAQQLFSPAVESNVHRVARHPDVEQRAFAWLATLGPGVVVEARACGRWTGPKRTFLLTASLRQRAERKYQQLRRGHRDVTLGWVEHALSVRDESDDRLSNAHVDAVVVHTDGRDLHQVVGCILEHLRGSGVLPM